LEVYWLQQVRLFILLILFIDVWWVYIIVSVLMVGYIILMIIVIKEPVKLLKPIEDDEE
jgi:hypothetical protein